MYKRSSKEQTSHSTTHTLTIVQNVKFVNKLMEVVAGFGNGRQICLQKHVVVLLWKRENKMIVLLLTILYSFHEY